jgi:hypothetical protein
LVPPLPARTLVLIFIAFSFHRAVPALLSADPMPADSRIPSLCGDPGVRLDHRDPLRIDREANTGRHRSSFDR